MIIKLIAGTIGYIIISIIVMMVSIYADRKAGKSIQMIYDYDFDIYCVAGLLFPLYLPCMAIAKICEFIKIICIAIIETKIAIEESGDKE